MSVFNSGDKIQRMPQYRGIGFDDVMKHIGFKGGDTIYTVRECRNDTVYLEENFNYNPHLGWSASRFTLATIDLDGDDLDCI